MVFIESKKNSLNNFDIGRCDKRYHDIIYIHGRNLSRKQIKNLTTFLNKLGLKIRKTNISFSGVTNESR